LLEGKNVNLRVLEKEDLALFAEWVNNPDFYGDYDYLDQRTRAEIEKRFENYPPEDKKFVIQKKDGTRIGIIVAEQHSDYGGFLEIGFNIVPNERGKGYCSEAAKIVVDYLFLSRSMVRIQARTDTRNLSSQRVLEKTGFQKEGLIRKGAFIRGDWRDLFIYSILREEWKEPKILTRTEKK
jgi:RimJ/RimL family protein N-acetyltransferase